MRRRGGRFWLVAAFALALTVAGPAAPARAADGRWLDLERIWSWLTTMLPGETPATASVDKCSSIDPNGSCLLTGGYGDKGPPVAPKAPRSKIDPND